MSPSTVETKTPSSPSGGSNSASPTTIDALQREVLEAVALSLPLERIMVLLCERMEALAPGVICTVLTIDAAGRVHPMAAPSLPKEFSIAIENAPIGPRAGSCGTAAWRGESVEVSDIASDPLWEDYRGLAQAFGLAACWSTPIFDAAGQVAATFALYYRQPRPVEPLHRAMVQACVHLCQIALRHAEHERRIEHLASYDSVTGLPNRSLFADRARQALQMALHMGTQGALLLLDIDRFKTFNDSQGHGSGDRLLCELGKRLQSVLRATDTLARQGGDEFVLVLPGCGPVEAQAMASRLHAQIRTPLLLSGPESGVEVKLTASIGIVVFPDDGSELDVLMKNVDLAMYGAKGAGRDCTRFFHQAMNQQLDRRLRIEAGLRRALRLNGFRLNFQPKVSLSDGVLRGVEALLRWTDEELGPVAPDVFIPVAEEAGLITAIDAWVLAAACEQLAVWRAAGVPVPTLAVNVSPPRFRLDDLAGDVAALLRRHGLQAQDLTLEVTERLMLEDDEHARDQLQLLDAMGVRLSVDDFGTGYSSLSYLKRLPVTELKLDRSFVRDLETDANDRALAAAIVGIGRSLSLTVVAEGVETPGQRQALLDMGCEVAQGWLFARAMPAQELAGWLSNR
ncbi:MAG TPA: EAL domain-containing protein [Burkholderiaceae bacterium]|jgi:diguanylate cyclase (GGDEF)-like protein